MNTSKKGHDFERQIRKLFIDNGWQCTRAAASMSSMDLVGYYFPGTPVTPLYSLWNEAGYTIKESRCLSVPLTHLATKREGNDYKHVYWDLRPAVLMQCKINKVRVRK